MTTIYSFRYFRQESPGFGYSEARWQHSTCLCGCPTDNVPEPFKKRGSGGAGTRMHHKFVVIDFDKPTARVYLGSYNFSSAADTSNGENLLLIRDRKIALSYLIEAVRIIDHYHFRVSQQNAQRPNGILVLSKPPAWLEKNPGGKSIIGII